MKKIYLSLLAIVTIVSCNNIPQTKHPEVDDRPKKELTFIAEFANADSSYLMQNNAIQKKEALDSGKVKVMKLIKNDLNFRIDKWPAIIKQISVNEWPIKMIEVDFFVPFNKHFELKDTSSVYKAINFNCKINYDDVKLRTLLKDYNSYDNVLLSATFIKDAVGDIDFTNKDLMDDSYTFTNPQFSIDIIDLKKLNSK